MSNDNTKELELLNKYKSNLSSIIEKVGIAEFMNIASIFYKESNYRWFLKNLPTILEIEDKLFNDMVDRFNEIGVSVDKENSIFSLSPLGLSILMLNLDNDEDENKTIIEVQIFINNGIATKTINTNNDSFDDEELISAIDNILIEILEKSKDELNRVLVDNNDDSDEVSYEEDSLNEDEKIIN